MTEKDMKWLEDMCDEYFEERKRLIKIKERYEKRGKDIPKNLDRRIRECHILYDFYDSLIKQRAEAEFNMERKRQESELMKSLDFRNFSGIPFGFNSFYGISPFIR